jgi:non-heme chloroperoxidase
MPFITSKFNPAEPVNIYYEDWGKGQPIVLIHGWPVSHEMWEYQMTELPSRGFRCIAYDRRGFGRSDKPWSGYDYGSLAGDLKALLEALDLKDVILVGFSMAGGELVRYCSQYGCDRIGKLVLLSSIAPYLLKTDDNTEGVPQEMFDDIASEIRKDRPAFLSGFGKQFFGVNWTNHAVSPEVLDWMQVLALNGSLRTTLECLRSFSETDLRKEMKSITVPTLIIHGDSDKTVPIKTSGEQAARLLPGAIFKVYEGAPHGLFITNKDELTADLEMFIKEGSVTDFEMHETVSTF